jgi:hypothetical protein
LEPLLEIIFGLVVVPAAANHFLTLFQVVFGQFFAWIVYGILADFFLGVN